MCCEITNDSLRVHVFFFQAEDGIRDLTVTGVQTCALPICFGPRVDAIVVYNSNPVAVAPESAKVVAGFARENLFTVVLEQFMTDTADLADYVLPATTQIEHWDIHGSYGHTDVLLNRPAIAPLGQARSNGQIFRDLAAHMRSEEHTSELQSQSNLVCR